MMPPPNVTGNLHMGHALNNTIQDILIDGRGCPDMKPYGSQVQTMPAYQLRLRVVDKITKEGKTKEELGRDGFLKEAWEWTELLWWKYQNQQETWVPVIGLEDRFT